MASLEVIRKFLMAAGSMELPNMPEDQEAMNRCADTWATLFYDVPDEAFRVAGASFLRNATFWPRPGDISKALESGVVAGYRGSA